jgi:ABC-type nitrate/sulfonate/bicarbonate transport system ATPase subunit
MPEVSRRAIQIAVSLFIHRLPNSYENLLGHWFDKGVELSVGEWQRLALARAFVRQAPIVILDEPTSAMDPWAEADWLRHFRELAAGRTALLITHRFTTAMLADQNPRDGGGAGARIGFTQGVDRAGGTLRILVVVAKPAVIPSANYGHRENHIRAAASLAALKSSISLQIRR